MIYALPLLASALDPRFCNLKFLNDRLDVKFKLTRLAQQSMQSVAVVKSPGKKKTKTVFDILLGKEEDDDDPCDSCAAEISQYFAEKVVPRKTDPLEWWKINELRFTHLSKVARSILCVPATSTASERLFSTAGLTVTNLRSCLKPYNVDVYVFLNKSFKLLADLSTNS